MKELYLTSLIVIRADNGQLDTAGGLLIADIDTDENQLLEITIEQIPAGAIEKVIVGNVVKLDDQTILGIAKIARAKGLIQ